MTDREILERLLYSLTFCDNGLDVGYRTEKALKLIGFAVPTDWNRWSGEKQEEHMKHLGITKGLWSE